MNDNPTVLILNGTMYVNAKNRALAEHPARLAAWQHTKGFWSSDDISHPFFHATGHEEYIRESVKRLEMVGIADPAFHDRYLQQFSVNHYYLSAEKTLWNAPGFSKEVAEKILTQVGRQALNSLPDFVAEVFAGLLLGRQFDEEIMQLYATEGGMHTDQLP